MLPLSYQSNLVLQDTFIGRFLQDVNQVANNLMSRFIINFFAKKRKLTQNMPLKTSTCFCQISSQQVECLICQRTSWFNSILLQTDQVDNKFDHSFELRNKQIYAKSISKQVKQPQSFHDSVAQWQVWCVFSLSASCFFSNQYNSSEVAKWLLRFILCVYGWVSWETMINQGRVGKD